MKKEKIIEIILCIVFIFIGGLLGDWVIDRLAIEHVVADIFIRGLIYAVFFKLGEFLAKQIIKMIKKSA